MNIRLEFDQILTDTALEHELELSEDFKEELFSQLKELFVEYCGEDVE